MIKPQVTNKPVPKQSLPRKKQKETTPRKPSDKTQKTASSDNTSPTSQPESNSTTNYYMPAYYGGHTLKQQPNSPYSDELPSENGTTLTLNTDLGENLSSMLEAQQEADRQKKIQQAIDTAITSSLANNSTQPALPTTSHTLAGSRNSGSFSNTGSAINQVRNGLSSGGKIIGR